MADSWGIDDGYHDVAGAWHETPEHTRRALRVAMGGLSEVPDPPPATRPVWLVRAGSGPSMIRPAEIVLEDGTTIHAREAVPADLPLGYHDLHPDDGGPVTRLIVTPDRCAAPAARSWGWSAQLYATRSAASWGIGDLHDLAALVRTSGAQGAGVVAVNPLHAPLPTADQEPSPYFPSSRRYRNPLYLRIEAVPGFSDADPVLADAAAAGRALNNERLIDRDAVWALKRRALETLWAARRYVAEPRYDAYRAHEGAELDAYATFCALAEHHGSGWRTWPNEHRRPEAPGVARFSARHSDRVAFHRWVQWLLDEQLAAAASAAPEVGLLGDLAVGVDPDGADGWLWQDVFAPGVRVGAPPDEFNREGQDWGLPPFVPWKLRALGYEPFVATLRSALRHVAALRVDHVMGLFRLYWLPPGAPPTDGAYVRYPGEELLDVVALESARAGVAIVGEDLGTVEDSVRHALHSRGVLSYRVAWFEDAPPSEWPEQSLGSITTHDLPTLAGVWTGSDSEPVLRERLTRVASLAGAPMREDTPVADVAIAAHAALGAGSSQLALATLDDALLVAERPNVPGTTTERPNWSLALPATVDDLPEKGVFADIARSLSATRPVPPLGD